MAIVKTVISGTATVHIDDSCCTGLSPEEIARRWAVVDRAIQRINYNHAARVAAGDGHEEVKPWLSTIWTTPRG